MILWRCWGIIQFNKANIQTSTWALTCNYKPMRDKVYWLKYRLATVGLRITKWRKTQLQHVILFVASIYSVRPVYIMSPDMFTESLIHFQVFRYGGEQAHTGKRGNSFEIDIMTHGGCNSEMYDVNDSLMTLMLMWCNGNLSNLTNANNTVKLTLSAHKTFTCTSNDEKHENRCKRNKIHTWRVLWA